MKTDPKPSYPQKPHVDASRDGSVALTRARDSHRGYRDVGDAVHYRELAVTSCRINSYSGKLTARLKIRQSGKCQSKSPDMADEEHTREKPCAPSLQALASSMLYKPYI